MRNTNKKWNLVFVLGLALSAVFVLGSMWAAAAQVQTPASGPLDLSVETFATGLNAPVDIANAGDERLFVVEQGGTIRVVQPDGTVLSTPFLDITDRVRSIEYEQGLLGLVFHPDYASNGYFYVNYTRNPDGDTVVSRFSVTNDPNLADPDSEVILMVIPQPAVNHNGGDLNFGPNDGYLYISTGDGGGANDPNNNAQNSQILLGKILRIDVDGGGNAPDCASGPYTIPADNPFADGAGGDCDEIWALGLRNPWRFSFDPLTGDMFIGDVGQNAWEEIDYEPASSNGGMNWGWRCYEGNAEFNTSGCGPQNDYDFPIYTYALTGGNCAVTGGYVYRGGQYPLMVGHYLFTDFCSGNFWDAVSDGGGGWTITAHGNIGVSSISAFGEGADGELYLARHSPGTIFRLVENTVFQTNTPTPTAGPTGTPTPTPTASPTNTPTPTPTPTQPINLETVASGFTEPVAVANAGDERLFVAERGGLIYQLDPGSPVTPTLVLSLTGRVNSTGWQQGLLGMAFHPDFAQNGYLFVNYTDANNNTVIERFTFPVTVTAALQRAGPISSTVILTVTQPVDDNNGGHLAFGPDGYLYIGLGDGGGSDDPNLTAQNTQLLLGKMLRIDVDGNGLPPDCASGPYTIPADNPFADGAGGDCDEIWALGLRNPWRFSFDALTGDMFIGDVGAESAEEIDFQPSSSTGGENYGWSCYEASLQGPNFSAQTCTETYTFPIHEYTHAVGHSITGGYVYRGCRYEDMFGSYYFADFVMGTLWRLTPDGMGGWDVETLLQAAGQISSFGEGYDGELYVLDYGSGTLYHLAGNVPGTCSQAFFPLILNQSP